jgi:hypothetical protein
MRTAKYVHLYKNIAIYPFNKLMIHHIGIAGQAATNMMSNGNLFHQLLRNKYPSNQENVLGR